mmetsp:Transcript_149259/g.388208  ORF Transcript_149259/g.388208 Transcript_149259/m.388208 type:complete len:533 (+) Transcript_149259:45-1643(+)
MAVGSPIGSVSKRRPALGGALAPTREDAEVSQDAIFEYSQRLSQQVVALEAENVELQDEKARLASENRRLTERAQLLEADNGGLRDAGFVTLQERHIAVKQAQDSIQAKNGEVMLLRNNAEQQRKKSEALSADLQRLRGINERLQAERSQLQRNVLGLEATANAMQVEMAEQAATEARATEVRNNLQRHVHAMTDEMRLMDEQAGVRYVLDAQLRHAREELSAERFTGQRLREELRSAQGEAGRLRADAFGMSEQASEMRAQTAHMRHVESAICAEQPRLNEALQRERAASASLRARVTELEGLIGNLRRAQTSMESENISLRTALDGARAEAHRTVEGSAQLVADRFGAEQDANTHLNMRREAERKHAMALRECELLREQGEVLRGDHSAMQSRLQQVEADNVLLRGKLKGAEVLASGLREECAGLNTRAQFQQLQEEQAPRPASPLPQQKPQHGLCWMPQHLTPPPAAPGSPPVACSNPAASGTWGTLGPGPTPPSLLPLSATLAPSPGAALLLDAALATTALPALKAAG